MLKFYVETLHIIMQKYACTLDFLNNYFYSILRTDY